MGLISRVSSRTYRDMPTIGELLEQESETRPLGRGSKARKASRKNDRASEQAFKAVKGAPLERSSKRPPPDTFLSAPQTNTHKTEDPRFSEDFGTYRVQDFDKYYGFIEDIEKAEIDELKKKKSKLAKTVTKKARVHHRQRTRRHKHNPFKRATIRRQK